MERHTSASPEPGICPLDIVPHSRFGCFVSCSRKFRLTNREQKGISHAVLYLQKRAGGTFVGGIVQTEDVQGEEVQGGLSRHVGRIYHRL